ncbi:MAG: hypothetical protein IT307_14375 [Chloroflexi bacterium]|nr:hypothetical protein [Chloroflexota bacterium]
MQPMMLVLLLVILVLIVGGFMLYRRLSSSDTGRRAARVVASRLDGPTAGPARREPSVDNLLPGDVVSFADEGDHVVQSVLECSEQVGPRSTGFRWALLDGNNVLESASDGAVFYTRRAVAYQGGEQFQKLVAPPTEGGALKTFEVRVQAGTIASNPVVFQHDGGEFHLRSTGTFTARTLGATPGEVFADITPNADDNVYFEAESRNGDQLLGIWTTHILLLVGRPVSKTDIEAIYPGSED